MFPSDEERLACFKIDVIMLLGWEAIHRNCMCDWAFSKAYLHNVLINRAEGEILLTNMALKGFSSELNDDGRYCLLLLIEHIIDTCIKDRYTVDMY